MNKLKQKKKIRIKKTKTKRNKKIFKIFIKVYKKILVLINYLKCFLLAEFNYSYFSLKERNKSSNCNFYSFEKFIKSVHFLFEKK